MYINEAYWQVYMLLCSVFPPHINILLEMSLQAGLTSWLVQCGLDGNSVFGFDLSSVARGRWYVVAPNCFLSSKQGDSSSNHLGMWKIKTPMQYRFTVFSICCVWDVFLSCLVRFESEPKTEVGTKFGSKYNAAYKTLYWKRLLFIFDHQMAVWIHRWSVRCWRRLRSTGAFTNKQQTWIAI